jgi:tetratricopeptide (TPR) repeat protein
MPGRFKPLQQRWSSADLIESVQALLSGEQFEQAHHSLELMFKTARTQRQQLEVLQAIKLVPLEVQIGSEAWLLLCARAFCVAADLSGLRDFLEQVPGLELVVQPYRAWLALRSERFETALELGKSVVQAEGFELGLLWRIRGVALFELGGDGWREAFTQAKTVLTGISLGRCLLEEGVCEDQTGSENQARSIWAQALALLQHDPYYAAKLRYNIGLSCLRNLLPEAETHFLEMERLSHRSEAREFRGRAMCGIAASRRALKEFERAAFTYQLAVNELNNELNDDDDRRQAHWGLGHTYRLMGRFTDALKEFDCAAKAVKTDRDLGTSWVFVSIAAIHAQTGNLTAAHLALERSGSLKNQREDALRAQVIRAELARQNTDLNLAIRELEHVPTETLLAREERTCFPALFAIAEMTGRASGSSEPEPVRTLIHIQAWGPCRVKVNGRAISLKSGGRAAELLALLAYNNGRLSSERILEAMYRLSADTDERRRKGQALWATANELRKALGWTSSISNEGGVYHLDERAIWEISPADLRVAQPRTERFLDGVNSQWVLDANLRFQEVKDRHLN